MWLRTIILALLFLSAVVAGSVMLLSAFARGAARSRPLTLLTAFAVCYIVGVYIEFESAGLEGMMLGAQIGAGVLAFTPVFWLLFVCEYVNKPMPKFARALLFVPPALSCAALWTNPYHGLFYSRAYAVYGELGPRLALTYGPVFYLNAGYFAALGGLAAALLIRRALSGEALIRVQVRRMLAGALLIVLTSAVYTFGAFRLFDITALSVPVACLMLLPVIGRAGAMNPAHPVREAAVDTMLDAWIAVDADGRYMDANLEAFRLFPELRLLPVGAALSRESKIPQEALDAPCGEAGLELELPCEGAMQYYRVSVSEIAYAGALVGKAILLSNITQIMRYRQQLLGLATTDYLTGLLNRRGFFELAEREVARAARGGPGLSVISLDIDHFKQINDQYGHQTGDNILVVMSHLFKSRLRKNDIFSRFGGEEFLILLPDTRSSNAVSLAERLRVALAAQDQRTVSGARLRITASFGVASMTADDMVPLEALIRSADEALYEAKEGGRNRVCVARAIEHGPPPPPPEGPRAVPADGGSTVQDFSPRQGIVAQE